jgi:hypothetical protein
VARRKLAETTEALLRDEEPALTLTVHAALALHREAYQRDLAARERWLAQQLSCQERTARRRVDEAFEILVQRAGERGTDDLSAADGWQVQSIRAVLNLDGPSPELTEQRKVAMLRDGVSEIVTRFSLPRQTPGSRAAHELVTTVEYGGRIREVGRPADEHWRYVIELPRTLKRGETHEYAIKFRIPTHQVMAPHYALVPLLTVKALDLTIRFSPDRLPTAIWRFDGVPPRLIDSPRPVGRLLAPDRFGEVRLSFRRLRQGLGYGAKWRLDDDLAQLS